MREAREQVRGDGTQIFPSGSGYRRPCRPSSRWTSEALVRRYRSGEVPPEQPTTPQKNKPRNGVCFFGGAIQLCSNILDRKSTRLNSSHMSISYAAFCLKKQHH